MTNLKKTIRCKRYLLIILIGWLIVSGLVVVTAVASPNPAFYGHSEASQYDPFGVFISYDVTCYIINNGDAGTVFYKFYETRATGDIVYSSKVFEMGAGERVTATTYLSGPPQTFNTLHHEVHPAELDDSDVGNVTIFRLDAPASMTITAPKAGEEWYSGHPYRISWQYTGEPGSRNRIELLKGIIVSNITQSVGIGYAGYGFYDWSIPMDQTPGNDYQIRITSDSGYTTTSNTGLTITKPSIIVTSPNGGEVLERGKVFPISWNYHDDPRFDSLSKVKVELYDNGNFPHYIANVPIGRGGNGSYFWMVGWDVFPGTNYTIHLGISGGLPEPIALDDSNGSFIISNPANLTVGYPNGGEKWYYDKSYMIQWYYPESLSGTSATIELLKSGTVHRSISSNLYMYEGGLSGTYGFYRWEIPADLMSGGDYRIQIRCSSGAIDASDAVFTIGRPWIAVTAPAGGEIWERGEMYDIKWEFDGIDLSEDISLDLLKSGIVERKIEPDYPISMPFYHWAVPTNVTPGNDYSVRITTTSGYSNTSEGFFTIGVPASVANFTERIGIYQDGWWYLDSDGSNAWNSGDKSFAWGRSTDKPVLGNWNGDGKIKTGIFRNGLWILDYDGSGTWSASDKVGYYGGAGSTPIVGDWNNDQKDEIGIYQDGWWYLDSDGSNAWNSGDKSFAWGRSTDKPVLGDWNGDGRMKAGIFRNGTWILDYDGSGTWSASDKVGYYGGAGSTPIVGDWNNDHKDEIGIYQDGWWYLDSDGSNAWNSGDTSFAWGSVGDKPVLGDWNADGKIKAGIFRNGLWILDYDGSGTWSTADKVGYYGGAGSTPIVGKWD